MGPRKLKCLVCRPFTEMKVKLISYWFWFYLISQVFFGLDIYFTITIFKVDHNPGKREILVVLNAAHQMIIEQRQHLGNLVVKTPFGPQEVNRQPEHPVREGLH